MLKRLAPIFFLFFILLTIGGYYPLFKIEQWQLHEKVKSLIKNDISESKLHLLDFTEGENIDWENKGEELCYKNNMYDVVKSKKENGHTLFYCLTDNEETELFSQLDQMAQKENSTPASNGKNTINLVKNMLSLSYVAAENISIPYLHTNALNRSAAHLFNYSAGFSETAKQPPKGARLV
jgi:hypothetical protein